MTGTVLYEIDEEDLPNGKIRWFDVILLEQTDGEPLTENGEERLRELIAQRENFQRR